MTSFARADGGEVPDLWRRAGGLGPAGAEAWSVLRAGAATAAEIVAATGRSRRTVARCLERMWRLGLVEPLGDGSWRALPDADLDAAARAVGVAGAGARQRERHRQERAAQRAIWRCWRQGAPADDD